MLTPWEALPARPSRVLIAGTSGAGKTRLALLRTILTDKEHVVRWAWSTHHKTGMRVGALLRQDPAFPVVRIRTRRQAQHWLDGALTGAARS